MNAFSVDQAVYKEPRPASVPGCEDRQERCWSWAEQGECVPKSFQSFAVPFRSIPHSHPRSKRCKNNPGFMLLDCRASCEACNDPPYVAVPKTAEGGEAGDAAAGGNT